MEAKVQAEIMEAEAQTDAMMRKTHVKLEYTAGETPKESEGPLMDMVEPVDSELTDLSIVENALSAAVDMIQVVKSKRRDIQATTRDEKMKLTAQLHTERKRYFAYRTALRRELQRDLDEKSKLEKKITDLEGQKETLQREVTLMQGEQAEHKRKLEEAATLYNSMRDKTTKLVKDLQSLKDEKDKLALDSVAMTANLEKEREKSLCEFCMKIPKDTVYFPCLHLSACFSCSEKNRKRKKACPPACPTCFTTVKSLLQLADQH